MTNKKQLPPEPENICTTGDLPETVLECEHFQSSLCRSCRMLDHTYIATLQHKLGLLKQLFPETRVSPFVPCQKVAGGRIRAKLAVAGTIEKPQIGFFDDRQTLAAVSDCPLHHPLINEWTARLPSIIRETRLMPYDKQTDRVDQLVDRKISSVEVVGSSPATVVFYNSFISLIQCFFYSLYRKKL